MKLLRVLPPAFGAQPNQISPEFVRRRSSVIEEELRSRREFDRCDFDLNQTEGARFLQGRTDGLLAGQQSHVGADTVAGDHPQEIVQARSQVADAGP